MDDDKKSERANGVHWSFWLVAGVSFVWNAGGVANYFVQMNPEALAAYSEGARSMVVGRPAWATAAFAIAVFVGTIGSLLLLLRRKLAIQAFIIALIASVITMIPVAQLDVDGAMLVSYVVMPLAVGGFLIWFSIHSDRAGWLR